MASQIVDVSLFSELVMLILTLISAWLLLEADAEPGGDASGPATVPLLICRDSICEGVFRVPARLVRPDQLVRRAAGRTAKGRDGYEDHPPV
jgi:hypothetical protein